MMPPLATRAACTAPSMVLHPGLRCMPCAGGSPFTPRLSRSRCGSDHFPRCLACSARSSTRQILGHSPPMAPLTWYSEPTYARNRATFRFCIFFSAMSPSASLAGPLFAGASAVSEAPDPPPSACGAVLGRQNLQRRTGAIALRSTVGCPNSSAQPAPPARHAWSSCTAGSDLTVS